MVQQEDGMNDIDRATLHRVIELHGIAETCSAISSRFQDLAKLPGNDDIKVELRRRSRLMLLIAEITSEKAICSECFEEIPPDTEP